jgi:hypothetical protein
VSLIASVIDIQNTYANLPTDDDSDQQQVSASVEGTLISKSGSDLVVGKRPFIPVYHHVRRHGDVQELTVLQIGMMCTSSVLASRTDQSTH